MTSIKFKLMLIVLMVLSQSEHIAAYDDKTSHKRINENAVVQSTLDEVLKDRLGFAGGQMEKFKYKEAIKWIINGGEWEDAEIALMGPVLVVLSPDSDLGVNILYGPYPPSKTLT